MAFNDLIPPSHRRPDYGQGAYHIDTPARMFSPQAMVAHLRQVLTSSGYQPPVLPAIALELLRLTRQNDVSLLEVRQLLERDPLLAAKVLQIAQSALYTRGAAIQSLEAAIARLGLRTLGDVFLQTTLSTRVFRAKGYDEPMSLILRHSTLTAHIARIACRMTAISDEYAFTCGLLHDVGFAAGLMIFADPRTMAASLGAEKRDPPAFDEVSIALQVVHEETSAILAHAWRLPADITLVLGAHHHPQIGERSHPLAAAVCVADWIASEVGLGLGTESSEMQARGAASYLGFSAANLADITERARVIAELL
jgi:HD-like signal output (HDOD) protein